MTKPHRNARIALSTVDSEEEARKLATLLVEAGLAACVNIVPGVVSVYRWRGRLCQDAEWLLVIKTRESRLAELESRLRAVHSYETPELIVLEIVAGSSPYLEWLNEMVEEG